jgi:oligopeptide/dipeptide ABC transporter ATP-binding protein
MTIVDSTGVRAVLTVEELAVHFRGAGRHAPPIKAVDGVSFAVAAGETLGVVGESGCGKSTTGRAALQLIKPTHGRVWLGDTELTALDEEPLRRLRPRMQMIFQDSYASLNPRHDVGRIIAEPMMVHHGVSRRDAQPRVLELLELVGLRSTAIERFPHEFSGGQRQRINIARALSLQPELIVCDEPISALDVSIQAQIVNLLVELQREFDLSYVFIAHDLSMVEHIAHRVAVMYLGHIAESGPVDELFSRPAHPYTRALLSAVPIPVPEIEASRRRIPLVGEVPSPQSPPPGCAFSTRCPEAIDRCTIEAPVVRTVAPGHDVACHLA